MTVHNAPRDYGLNGLSLLKKNVYSCWVMALTS